MPVHRIGRAVAAACLVLSMGAGPGTGAGAAPAAGATSTPGQPRLWQRLPPAPPLPTPTRQGTVQVNGIALWYAQYRPVEARPSAATAVPVLLLHGGFASSSYYGHLIPALIAEGYTVVVADSRGQGRSTQTAAPFGYKLFASDITGLLAQLGLSSVDIVGWSDGGIVGLELAMQRPSPVHRLFAFGANVSLKGLKPDAAETPVFAEYLRRTADEFRQNSPTPDAFDTTSKKIIAMWSHEPNYSRAQLARIAVPVTISDGQYDEAIRTDHDMAMAQMIPGANLVMLPNVSHFAMLQNPAQFNEAVLAFLRYR